jgi:hypothetical protein
VPQERVGEPQKRRKGNDAEKALQIAKKAFIISSFLSIFGSHADCCPGPVISVEVETKRSLQESK